MIRKFSENLSQLVEKARSSENGIYRQCFHDNPNANMQLMLIAFKPYKRFDYIRDLHSGRMAFTCLYGIIKIRTICEDVNTGKVEEYSLHEGELLYLPRRCWRMTETEADGAVFTESIEGKFNPAHRQIYGRTFTQPNNKSDNTKW